MPRLDNFSRGTLYKNFAKSCFCDESSIRQMRASANCRGPCLGCCWPWMGAAEQPARRLLFTRSWVCGGICIPAAQYQEHRCTSVIDTHCFFWELSVSRVRAASLLTARLCCCTIISSHPSLNISRVFVLTSLATAIYSLVYNWRHPNRPYSQFCRQWQTYRFGGPVFYALMPLAVKQVVFCWRCLRTA